MAAICNGISLFMLALKGKAISYKAVHLPFCPSAMSFCQFEGDAYSLNTLFFKGAYARFVEVLFTKIVHLTVSYCFEHGHPDLLKPFSKLLCMGKSCSQCVNIPFSMHNINKETNLVYILTENGTYTPRLYH